MTRKAMLIDLKRCAGCGSCVVACQMQNNTRPGISWNTLSRCEWGEYPNAGVCYLPHSCMHCDEPDCVAVCTTGASYQTSDGVVLTDYNICIGCKECVKACPYGARHLSTNNTYFFDANDPAPYEAHGVQRMNVTEKCIFCYEMVEQGLQPACVTNCPTRARIFGDIDDPTSEIAKKAQGAIRIGQSGFYYIKPANMPGELISSTVIAPPYEDDDDDITKSSDPTVPILIGVGAAAVIAAGIGAGVGVSKSKKKKASANEEGE